MTCAEAAEFVSALADGEVISREAAEHIGACMPCRACLAEYMEMGAELRRAGSLEIEESVSPRIWNKPQGKFAVWWRKGWGDMRIPRLAFGSLIAAIFVLASSLAVVRVGAHSAENVVMLKIAGPKGGPVACPLSTQEKQGARCGFMGQMNGKIVGYQIDLVGREGRQLELAIRGKSFSPLVSGSFSLSDAQKEPPKQVFFEPGQTLKLDLADIGTLTITGEWFDHMPQFIGSSSDLAPGPAELRVVSPLLLSGKEVLGDMEGGSAVVDKADWGVRVYMPGEGLFILSLSSMHGAAQARVAFNRISFEDQGRSYTLLTGSPVTRAEHIWVLHQPDYKPLDQAEARGSISAGDLNQLVPGAISAQ